MSTALQTITGLASNLDTSAIIDAIIEYESEPVTLMTNNKTELTNEVTTFQALSAKLLALRTSIVSLNNANTFNQASISVSDEDLLVATAAETVSPGTYSVNIASLAKNHQIASQGFDSASQTILGTGTITLALGDDSATTITIDEGENSLIGIKNAINNANVGITASIINDGTTSNPYRLLLSGNETGQANEISITSSLTGGLNLDYVTSSFDDPEEIKFSTQATSNVSLGTSASYTGTTNKTFTFTIGGSGVQTVGDGNITINWTDGTNSGSIVVSQADEEVVGPEGLKLSFSDGDLVAGNTFRVTAMAPLLQEATDATITVGSSDGEASPITLTSDTNTFENAIAGLTLNVEGVTTSTTGPVVIEAGINTSDVVSKVQSFISAYNSVMDYIDQQNTYDSDTEEAGVLMGDLTLLTIQSRLRNTITNPIAGLDSDINSLAAIGIRTDSTGNLALTNSSLLTNALEENYEAVKNLFVDSGSSTNAAISFLSAPSDFTGGSSLTVDITQAATHGYLEGTIITDPSSENITLTDSNNKLKFVVDGVVSNEIVLMARTYTSGEDLANEIQTRINADSKIGNKGVTVEWVQNNSSGGHLEFTSSSYGSDSRVDIRTSGLTNTAFSVLGLTAANSMRGLNVEGTINGESATGKGQILTGNNNNLTTAGLKLQITLTEAQIDSGNSQGTITVSKGMSSVLGYVVESMTDSKEGIIASKTSGLNSQIENIENQIEDFNERLDARRELLETQFEQMETLLSELQSEGSYLESQLESISTNWASILGKD